MAFVGSLGFPQGQVGMRHIQDLAGVVDSAAVQVTAGGFLQRIEGAQGVGILAGVELEPGLVCLRPTGSHQHRHIGRSQVLLPALLPGPRQQGHSRILLPAWLCLPSGAGYGEFLGVLGEGKEGRAWVSNTDTPTARERGRREGRSHGS